MKWRKDMVELIDKKNRLSPTEELLFNRISKTEEQYLWLKDHYFQLAEDMKHIISILKKQNSA